MQIAAILAVAVVTTGCLKPLVDDVPSGSVHLLPSGATVPSATDSPDLANQITVNSGLDNKAVAAAGGVIARGSGWSAGAAVRFWAFGRATTAPSPMYELYRDTGAGLTRLPHPPLVDAVPGDPGYSPLHTLLQVVVTDAYHDELITSSEALGDAIELGLVKTPAPTGTFVGSPIVLPAIKLEVGGSKGTQAADVAYAHGHIVGVLRLGGTLGVQPTAFGFLPSSQLSLLREDHAAVYDPARPVFQATIPIAPPAGKTANYTALSVVVNVDLAKNVTAASITQDSDLFNRGPTGAITSSTDKVAQFQITTTSVMQALQFEDGQP